MRNVARIAVLIGSAVSLTACATAPASYQQMIGPDGQTVFVSVQAGPSFGDEVGKVLGGVASMIVPAANAYATIKQSNSMYNKNQSNNPYYGQPPSYGYPPYRGR